MTERTKTITKAKVDEIEIAEYQCKSCEQWYEEKEILPVLLNNEEHRNICIFCAENLFGYTTNTTKKAKIIEGVNSLPLLEVAVKLFIVGIAFNVLTYGVTVMLSQVGQITTLIQENPSNPDSIMGLLLPMVPFITLLYFTIYYTNKW